ncbi:hypothetical protein [Acinetobacter terrae]|jgi:hypothetical protein|uniref:hypothetical protein n=1 Tax=Acinetobacter terrae TaxID=2731247 RepID=UPI001D176851|nr:hypothetical protein [Acinetobacter terrae]
MIKQHGKILSRTKKIDAEGVEFKQGQEPIHRTLKLDPEKNWTVTLKLHIPF